MTNGYLTPAEVSRACVGVGETKAKLSLGKMFLLAVLAGVYIGFAAQAAIHASTGQWQEYPGIKQLVFGGVFTVGLMLVVIAGAELFTGNNLMTVALCSGRIGFGSVLRNWTVVYLGNLAGSLLLVVLLVKGGAIYGGPSGSQYGATALKIATAKTSAAAIGGVPHALAMFFRAIGCNWLVCLAVFMAISARDVTGKILAMFFPVMAFVISGYEHSIANMYFIPAGLFAKASTAAVAASGLKPTDVAGLTWSSMWAQNLIPVTLGNIVGGAIFVGMVYFYAHLNGTEARERTTELVKEEVRSVR